MRISEGRRRGIRGSLRFRTLVILPIAGLILTVLALPVSAMESDAGGEGLPVAQQVVQLAVNFQTSNAATPVGWSPDTGLPFEAERGYGWTGLGGTTAAKRQCGDREVLTDQILDTFCHAQTRYVRISGRWHQANSPALWEAEVPDGTYEVTVTMGDPFSTSNSVHNVAVVEGVPAIEDFSPTDRERHRRSTTNVLVVDGRLTVDPTPGVRGRITAIRITTSGFVESTPPAPIDVSFQPRGADVPDGWIADSGDAYSFESGMGWRSAIGGMALSRQCGDRNQIANQVLDTFCHAQTRYEFVSGSWRGVADEVVWELAVQDGVYDVTVVMGESRYAYRSVINAMTVEEVVAIDGHLATGAGLQVSATVRVVVTDGFLTLDPGRGRNGKVASVSIVPHLAPDTAK